MMHGFGFGFGLLGPVLMLLFWGGLILLSVWLVKSLFQGNNPPSRPTSGGSQTAKEVLDQRYARGEINREQYEIMKKDII